MGNIIVEYSKFVNDFCVDKSLSIIYNTNATVQSGRFVCAPKMRPDNYNEVSDYVA